MRFVRGERRLWPSAGLVMVVLGGAALASYAVVTSDGEGTHSSIQTIAAVLVPAVTLAVWLWRQRNDARASPSVALDKIADRLAEQLGAQWSRAASERRLVHPAPIAVRWKWSDLPVTGPPADAVGDTPGRRRFRALPGSGPATADAVTEGRMSDLFALYAGLDSGRMAILGQPGAGKTAAAISLVLDALAHRAGLRLGERRNVPVPVLVSPRQWDPEGQGLVEWLADRLTREHPFLRRGPFGTKTAVKLIERGSIAIVLDGFDDIPNKLQSLALRALDEQATFRLVVLARSQELTTAAARWHLRGAAAIELLPVDPADAASYLERCQVHPPPKPWTAVIDCVRHQPFSPLAQALRTPLMLSLLRDTYGNGDPVDALLDTCRFDTPEAIEDHLLDQVLPATYTDRPGQSKPPYRLADAQCWLGFIARQMDTNATRDLAWWHIPRWAPSGPRHAVTGAVFAVTLGLVKWLQFGLASAVTAAIAVGLTYWMTRGRGRWFLPVFIGSGALGVAVGQAGPTLGPELGLMADAEPGSPARVLVGYTAVVLVLWASFALPLWLTTHIVLDAESPIDPIESWRRERRRWMASAATAGLAAALTIGLVVRVVFGVNVWLAVGLLDGSVVAMHAGLLYSRTWETFLGCQHLRRAGYLPRSMLRFLEDARRRNVLRTAGPVYQFRHARLQDRLTHIPGPADPRGNAQSVEESGGKPSVHDVPLTGQLGAPHAHDPGPQPVPEPADVP